MTSTLYGVGVGPGDPELITVKALRILTECDYIAIPSKDVNRCVAYDIVLKAMPNLKDKPVIAVDMPMIKDKEKLAASHDAGAALLCKHLDQGYSIAFVNLGDPTVYASYMYLHKRVAALGYHTEIISGITSFCAASAALGESLVETNEPLHIYPASYPIDDVFKQPGTKVLMKTGRKYSEVRELLADSSLNVNLVQNCGMENEQIFRGKDSLPEDSSYFTLIITKDA